jgi:hypothetical protein
MNMTHLLGVSMPRSGHHLLEVILKNTLKEDFAYCEYYEQDCCKSIPCKSTKSCGTYVFLQKSHDFDFTDPISIAGTCRIIQYRHPVPRALSNYELYLRNGASDNVETFREFLIDEAWYFSSFYKKWICERKKEFIFVSYEELTGDPYQTMFELLERAKIGFEPTQLVDGISQAIVVRGRDNEKFVAANVRSHRYSNYPVLANFEDIVIQDCPGYFPTRYFSAKDSEKSVIGMVFNAMKEIDRGHYENALELIETAYEHEPANTRLAKLRRTAAEAAEKKAFTREAMPTEPEESGSGSVEKRSSNRPISLEGDEPIETWRKAPFHFLRWAWNARGER